MKTSKVETLVDIQMDGRILIDELDPTLDVTILTSPIPNACDPIIMMLRQCSTAYHAKLDEEYKPVFSTVYLKN